jgi:hypothetical protein
MLSVGRGCSWRWGTGRDLPIICCPGSLRVVMVAVQVRCSSGKLLCLEHPKHHCLHGRSDLGQSLHQGLPIHYVMGEGGLLLLVVLSGQVFGE